VNVGVFARDQRDRRVIAGVVADPPHVHEVEPASRESNSTVGGTPPISAPADERRRNIIRDPLYVERDVEVTLGEKPMSLATKAGKKSFAGG